MRSAPLVFYRMFGLSTVESSTLTWVRQRMKGLVYRVARCMKYSKGRGWKSNTVRSSSIQPKVYSIISTSSFLFHFITFFTAFLVESDLISFCYRHYNLPESLLGRGKEQARSLSEDAGNAKARMGVYVLFRWRRYEMYTFSL